MVAWSFAITLIPHHARACYAVFMGVGQVAAECQWKSDTFFKVFLQIKPYKCHACAPRRYAWAAISEWQCSQGVSQRGRIAPDHLSRPKQVPNGAAPEGSSLRGRSSSMQVPMRRARSVACMTQLQAKQAAAFDADEADEAGASGGERASPGRCALAGCLDLVFISLRNRPVCLLQHEHG